MRRVVAVAALIICVALAIQARKSPGAGGPAGGQANGGSPRAESIPVGVVPVQRRDMVRTLEVSGTLRTDEDVQLGSRIEGRVKEVTVREGDRIPAGHVLVRLDGREVQAQLTRARAQLRAAEARLSLATNQSAWKDETARSDHQKAEAALATARARLQQAETSLRLLDTETRLRVETAQSGVRVATERLSIARDLTRKQDLAQAQLAVDQAEARYRAAEVDAAKARQYLERRQMLYRQDAVAREEVDEAERRHQLAISQVRVAETEVSAAKERLGLAREGSRAEEVRIAEGQLRAAERALEQAQSDLGKKQVAADEIAAATAAVQLAEANARAAKAGLVQTDLSQDEIRAARAAADQARADIAFYEAQSQDLTIRSPVAAVVSRRRVSPGEMVTRTSSLMDLVALDRIYLEAIVPELEVALLRPNARGEITVDAIPGRKFPASVREIIPVADSGSRSFRVRVAVLGAGSSLPAGGFSRGRFVLGTRKGVLAVPREAVQTELGQTFVWTVHQESGGTATAQRLSFAAGLADARHVEALSGLQEGQQVIVSGSPAIIDGTPVAVGER